MHQTGARMDFELVSTITDDGQVNHIEGTLHMRDGLIGVLMTPMEPPTVVFHVNQFTEIPPNTETLIECTAETDPPTYLDWISLSPDDRELQMLSVNRSKRLYRREGIDSETLHGIS